MVSRDPRIEGSLDFGEWRIGESPHAGGAAGDSTTQMGRSGEQEATGPLSWSGREPLAIQSSFRTVVAAIVTCRASASNPALVPVFAEAKTTSARPQVPYRPEAHALFRWTTPY